jgi:hypothetical protein
LELITWVKVNNEEETAEEIEMDKGERLALRLERDRSYWKDNGEDKKTVILFSKQKELIEIHIFQMMITLELDRQKKNNTKWKPAKYVSFETMGLTSTALNPTVRPCGFKTDGKNRMIKNT